MAIGSADILVGSDHRAIAMGPDDDGTLVINVDTAASPARKKKRNKKKRYSGGRQAKLSVTRYHNERQADAHPAVADIPQRTSGGGGAGGDETASDGGGADGGVRPLCSLWTAEPNPPPLAVCGVFGVWNSGGWGWGLWRAARRCCCGCVLRGNTALSRGWCTPLTRGSAVCEQNASHNTQIMA